MKEAFAKRPELQEQVYNLKNADIDVRATKNALLPSLTANAFYAVQRAGRKQPHPRRTYHHQHRRSHRGRQRQPHFRGCRRRADSGLRVGNRLPQAWAPSTRDSARRKDQIFHNRFPEYAGQLTLTLPLRNRAAQAEHVRALLTQRQMETAGATTPERRASRRPQHLHRANAGPCSSRRRHQGARTAAGNVSTPNKRNTSWGRQPLTWSFRRNAT